MAKLTASGIKAQAAERERQQQLARRVIAEPHKYRQHLIEWARLVLAPSQGGAVR
jgi:hypothetical protein